jgi:uncharacterized protein YjaG (DUF416 family)
MGMTMADFCEHSLHEYQQRCKGHRMRDANEWNRTRNIMWAALIAQGGAKKLKSPADVLKIPILDKGHKNDLFAAHYRLKARLLAEEYGRTGETRNTDRG